ncbi:signal recognition particle subunit SRP21 [Kluyveromyces marxianus]|uniref:Signal recognition particle subunit SRP21 n=1 Tax=Kluyveromyces marxianus (strain DMKU3-1042 / BCC 29191 / NBRC 104275) TaxID=1003335 RepID=W0T7L1_KLUMD|nr:signal recognition particle subunit SRP21 [Kluyveromyces marxianus DMKU3-1042]BAO39390.1 signal recognition particle subunit SRP21 [Kluyveromyces marxianus DMKU3-1042]BAP70892.1 signal recognition particle subunit SRP21 [Kluyveromyces marxianus]
MGGFDLDTFITSSLKVLETNGSGTNVVMKYKPGKKRSVVKFRTKNDRLGLSYGFKTRDAKEVSRGLSAMGPTGVSLPLGRVGKRVYKKKVLDLPGMSTLMVNRKVKKAPEQVAAAPAAASKSHEGGKAASKTSTTAPAGGKGGKKKSKKKSKK